MCHLNEDILMGTFDVEFYGQSQRGILVNCVGNLHGEI